MILRYLLSIILRHCASLFKKLGQMVFSVFFTYFPGFSL